MADTTRCNRCGMTFRVAEPTTKGAPSTRCAEPGCRLVSAHRRYWHSAQDHGSKEIAVGVFPEDMPETV